MISHVHHQWEKNVTIVKISNLKDKYLAVVKLYSLVTDAKNGEILFVHAIRDLLAP